MTTPPCQGQDCPYDWGWEDEHQRLMELRDDLRSEELQERRKEGGEVVELNLVTVVEMLEEICRRGSTGALEGCFIAIKQKDPDENLLVLEGDLNLVAHYIDAAIAAIETTEWLPVLRQLSARLTDAIQNLEQTNEQS